MPILTPTGPNAKEFVPNIKQREAIYHHEQHTLFAGGTRAGKTVACCFKALLLSRMFPKNLGLVGRQTFPSLRDTTMETFKALLTELGWRYEYKVAQQNFVFPNKSVIMFRYLDGFQPRQGLDLGWFFIDQIEEVSEEVFSVLMTRMSRELKPTKEAQFRELLRIYEESWQRITFHTCNMTPEDHWVYKKWKVNHERWKIGHPDHNPRFFLVECASDVNKANLPPDYFESLKDMPPDMIDRYRWGIWGGRSGRVYADIWNDNLHLIPELTPFADNAEFYRAFDHGGMADPGACIYAYFSPNPYDGELECIIFDTYLGEKQTITQHAKNINKIWANLDITLTYADPQVLHRTQQASSKEEATSIIDAYRDAGLNLIPAFRPVFAGIEKVRRWMHVVPDRPHRFLKGPDGEPVKGAPHVYFHRNCYLLVEQIKSLHYSEKVPGAIANSADDLADAVRYLLASPIAYRGGEVVDKATYSDAVAEAVAKELEAIESGVGTDMRDPYYVESD